MTQSLPLKILSLLILLSCNKPTIVVDNGDQVRCPIWVRSEIVIANSSQFGHAECQIESRGFWGGYYGFSLGANPIRKDTNTYIIEANVTGYLADKKRGDMVRFRWRVFMTDRSMAISKIDTCYKP